MRAGIPRPAAKRSRRVTFIGFALLTVVTGCSSNGEEAEDDVEQQPVLEITQTDVGTCLKFTDDAGAEVTELPVAPCGEPHSHEIIAIVSSGEDVYPGYEALEETALTECLAAFEEYVGINPFDSELFTSWLVPTLDSWNQEEDRDTICVAGNRDAAPLVGSIGGSNR